MRYGMLLLVALVSCIGWDDDGITVDPSPIIPDGFFAEFTEDDRDTGSLDGNQYTVGLEWDFGARADAFTQLSRLPDLMSMHISPIAKSAAEIQKEAETKAAHEAVLAALEKLTSETAALRARADEEAARARDIDERQKLVQETLAAMQKGSIPFVPKDFEQLAAILGLAGAGGVVYKVRKRNTTEQSAG